MKKMFASALETLQNWDVEHSLWIYEKGRRIPNVILRSLEWSGDGLFWIPVTAALCCSSSVLVHSFFRCLFVGFIFDLCLIGMMKVIVRRPRPIYNKGMYLVVSVDHYSFPSGHSSRAFLILVFIFEYAYQWKDDILSELSSYVNPNVDEGLLYWALGCLVAVWVMATASSRVLLGRHYVIDVVVGSLLGVLEALFVIRVLHLPIINGTQKNWLFEYVVSLWEEALLRINR